MRTVKFYPEIIIALALSAFLPLLSFLIQAHSGLSLRDEGFLWYGVQRTLQGEVPIRDFMSYDPGRYYFAAIFMSAFGDSGIVALRGVIAIVQWLTLFFAWLIMKRSTRYFPRALCISFAVTVMAWMFQRHKAFDFLVMVGILAALTLFLERPTKKRSFLYGIVLGVSTVFGRNHAIYGLFSGIAGLGLNSLASGKWRLSCGQLLRIVVGAALGAMPIPLMISTLPGFGDAYVGSLSFLFQRGSTNLNLPLPLPWTIAGSATLKHELLTNFLLSVFFVSTLGFAFLGGTSLIHQIRKKEPMNPLFTASVLIGLPYAHYAVSRADIEHVSLAVIPLVFATFHYLSQLENPRKLTGAWLFCALGVLVSLPMQTAWQCRKPNACNEVLAGNDRLRVDPRTASDISLLARLRASYPDQSFLAAPFWPGAYALFETRSPLWEIYAIWPRSDRHQEAEITRLQNAKPGFILLDDSPLDGREALRFRNSHAKLFHYIDSQYRRIDDLSPETSYLLYKRK